MKKFISIVAVILITALLSVAVVACGDNGGENGNGGGGGNSAAINTQTEAGKQAASDKAVLESNGYTVSVYTTGLDSMAVTVGAQAGQLECYISARSNEDAVLIYYFKDSSVAAECHKGKESYYKLVGYALVYGDNANLIK